MGEMYEWHCHDCQAGEEFITGVGMGSFNEREVIDLARDGKYGSLVKQLVGDGIPEGVIIFRLNAYFVCPECGEILQGEELCLSGDDGKELHGYAPPNSCPTCGADLDFMDDKIPLTNRELIERCKHIVSEGCPKCGGKNVESIMGCWD